MPFNGSGTFQRLRNWVNDAAANIRIRADYHDSEDDNFASGLSQCITKDGQTTVTANLPMANYKHTGVGAATSATDYARYDQLQLGKAVWAVAGGTADAITASYSPNTIAPVDGQLYYVRATGANTTTTPTFAPDGNTARTIVKFGDEALVAGDIAGTGHELILRYRASDTKYELLNPKDVLGTASTYDIGTSGAAVPLLNGNNTYSGTAAFTGSSLSYTRSGATPTLTLSREDAQAALTAISYITTTGKNDAGALLNVIRLVNYFTNVASGSEETRTQIESYIAGAATVIARFGPGVSFGNPTGGVPTTAGQLNATGYRVNNVLQPVTKSASLGNISSGVYTSVQAINTTVARTGTGTFTYTFGTAEADANYYVDFCCVEATSGGGGADAWIAAGTKTTTGFTIETGITGVSPSDPDQLMVKVWRIS